MKKIILLITVLFSAGSNFAQIYNFDNLSLQTYTTTGSSTKYAGIPAGFDIINDGLKNNIGSFNNPNKPFHEPGLKTTGWAVVYNAAENDTFLVSTSWLDTTAIPVNRWVITPLFPSIGVNSVLTWLAKSPDPAFSDGYEVYGTTAQGALTPQNFALGDRLFALTDGNTQSGGEKDKWTRRSVSLGAFANKQLRFAFRNNSTDMYQLWIDNIQVLDASNNIDVALSPDVPKKYILVNTNDSIKFNVSNLGATTVNTISVSYQVGNSSINTENIVVNGLSYGQSTLAKFALPFNFSSPGVYTIRSWINSVNGLNDQNLANDTSTYLVTVQNTSPQKKVLFEQFVSANNGEGPDAQQKTLALQSSSVIVVNIHDLDSLKEGNSAALINDYKKNIPTAMIDRTYFNDLETITLERQSYGHVGLRMNAITPVSVSVINKTYNATTRLLTFALKADFVGEVKGDYRFNAYLTENYVSGPVTDTTINGYNQLNNFFNVPWSSYYQKGYYSPAANTYVLNYWEYQHHNALVYAFDGAYGSSNVIPSGGGTQGQSYQKTFSLTVPTSTNGVHKFNPDNLYIVGFVAEYNNNKNNRNVLNAVKEKVTGNSEAVGIEEILSHDNLLIYPNPSSGILYFNTAGLKNNYQVSVFDLLGRCVKIFDSGDAQTLDLSGFPDGMYVLKINTGKTNYTEKVIIQK